MDVCQIRKAFEAFTFGFEQGYRKATGKDLIASVVDYDVCDVVIEDVIADIDNDDLIGDAKDGFE